MFLKYGCQPEPPYSKNITKETVIKQLFLFFSTDVDSAAIFLSYYFLNHHFILATHATGTYAHTGTHIPMLLYKVSRVIIIIIIKQQYQH